MKKFITSLLSLALVIGMCPAMIANAEATLSGSGTSAEDPYIIATADDLKLARDLINANVNGEADAYFKVTANITLPDGELWTPIAPYTSVPFTGTFDGGEHVISNINIELNETNCSQYTTRPNLGFFGTIGDTGSNGGNVTNLGLSDVSVVNNLDYLTDDDTTGWNGRPNSLGGFVGDINRTSVISGCFVKNATIENNGGNGTYMNIGGFFGTTRGGTNPQFTNCYVYNATISAGVGSEFYRDAIGGFAGTPGNAKTTFTNCYVAQTFTTQASAEKTAFYAFSRKGNSASTSASACYAEADDIATITDAVIPDGTGTHKDTYDYSTDKSLGTTGMTKDSLVEAMKAVGYATDATVNDGYPCLAWELPEVTATDKWDGAAAAAFATGDGSPENPYQITSAAELKLAADTVNTNINREACFILMNDIDYEGNAWEPIGYSNSSQNWQYKGNFDGNEHVIRNLAISTGDTAYTFCGFFGYVLGAEIKDLGIENIQINMANTSTAKASYIGAFAGRLRSCSVSNCYVKDSLVKQTASSGTESYGVAGFVSHLDNDSNLGSTITNCYVYDVDLYCGYGRAQCGFVAHVEDNAVITNCYANATNTRTTSTSHPVYGFGFTGNKNTAYTEGTTATISNCYSTLADANVTSTATFGTTGQSVATIAGVFESLEGWQDGENINAGLPALSWETAPVVVAADPYVVKQVSLAKGTVTLDVNEATAGDQVCIAAYDSNDRLVAAEFKDAAETVTTTVASSAGVAKVKVFVWNGLTPVINAVVKTSY